jgi:tRNA-dihydrouridine synthase
MREPEHAAAVVRAMARAVTIPVTVKMRAGWNDDEINAPELAQRIEEAGALAVTVHGRTAAQSYSGWSDWELIAKVAGCVRIPVIGSGDCVEPEQLVDRVREGAVSGVLVGRGALRNPWVFQQARDLAAGRAPRSVSPGERGQFLIDYIDLLLTEHVDEASGFRHVAPGQSAPGVGYQGPARGRERWVINKLRALNSWFTKGLDNGSHLRMAVNQAESIAQLREIIASFFASAEAAQAQESREEAAAGSTSS